MTARRVARAAETGGRVDSAKPLPARERSRRRRVLAWSVVVAYFGSVVAANWLIERFGVIPVGFGLSAAAGVLAVGPALVLRDGVQYLCGRAVALAALGVGAVVSYAVASPAVALASAVAFAVGEFVDFVVFAWLAPCWGRAVLFGGLVGSVVDSVLFLSIAFGSLAMFPGQLLGKMYAVVSASAVIGVLRSRRGQP